MEPEQIISPEQPKFRFRFLLIPTPLILGFIWFGLGFGCGLGGGGDFTCRVAVPSIFLGFLVSIITILVASVTPFPQKLNKIVGMLFVISFVVPIILLCLPEILPPDASLKYLEGLTPEACATQKPVVPWGKTSISPDSCYYLFDMCDQIQGYNLEGKCYARTQTFKMYSDCSVFKNWYNKLDCEMNIATSKKDFNFCSLITVPTVPTGDAVQAPDPSYVYEARHDCVMRVSGFDKEVSNKVSQNFHKNMSFEGNYCADYNDTIKRDVCYADTALNHQFGSVCAKISDTIPWFRRNCEDASDLKP